MSILLNKDCDLHSYSPLTLAFIGDGVYDLLVREHLVSMCNRPVKELNKMKVALVNCKAQADATRQLVQHLSEDELSVFKRGRNAQTNSVSKHSSIADYHSATGLECLFGYLYLDSQLDRIKELFTLIIQGSEVEL